MDLVLQFNVSMDELAQKKIKPLKTIIALFQLMHSILSETADFEKHIQEQKAESAFKAIFRFLFIGIPMYAS